MIIYKLLIVEDNQGQRQAISDSVREFNEVKKSEDISFVCDEAENIDIAQSKLKNEHYDSAIIDLVLTTTSKKADGNEVLQYIRDNFWIPVFVVSDFPDKLDPDLQKESDVFKIRQRTNTKYEDLINEIFMFLQSGITKVLPKLQGSIDSAMQELYWAHIAHNWNYWNENVSDEKQRAKIVSRYLSALLAEKLNLTDNGLDKSNVAEMFFIPPIKSDYYTGDIIDINNELYLLINPACDMVIRADGERSAESIIFLKLIPLTENQKFNDHFERRSSGTKKKIQSLVENKNSRYHYIPPYSQLNGFLLDFEKLFSITRDYLIRDKPKRIASITEPFLKNIITRFSSYYNRLGQPELEMDSLYSDLEKHVRKIKM